MSAADADGEYDWMDPTAGEQAARRIRAGATVRSVSRAGHHLYMENTDEFNSILVEEILRETY